MKHAISWFEIPATDIERAQKFYEALFEVKLIHMILAQPRCGHFPWMTPWKALVEH